MKKLILSTLIVLSFTGCSVDSLSSAKVSTSSFDGTKTIYSDPMPAWAAKNWMVDGVAFGARWNDKANKYVAVQVQFNEAYENLNKLFLNIDGKIYEYEPLATATNFSSAGAIKLSTRDFIIPLADLKLISQAKSVKYKVITLSNEYREGDLVKNGQLSPGAKSIINVVNQIPSQ